MAAMRALGHDIISGRTMVAHRRADPGLLGLAVLFMLCMTETAWLLTGNPNAASIVAAAEGIRPSQ